MYLVIEPGINWQLYVQYYYRPGTVNSKSFVRKVLLQIEWKLQMTEHKIIRNHFTETLN